MLGEGMSLPVDEDYLLIALTPEDGPDVQALLERSADYSELVMGLPPGPAEAQSLYAGLPEGKGCEDKLLFGVFTGERRLVGVLDAIRDYPGPGEWWVGLLLLEPGQRGRGLGERVYRVFERRAGTQGARGIRLAVLEQNTGAEPFWRHLGFEEVERKPATRLGALMSVPIVMRRPVSGS
jgi:GNAT superfamily N-acetyltransferase